MTIASAVAINEARAAVIALFDAVRPCLDHPAIRGPVCAAYEDAMHKLHAALYEATTARALGCVVRPLATWHKGIEARRRNG